MIIPAQPPEGILDPQQPWWPADRVGEKSWLILKARLTGRKISELSGTTYTSYVKLGDADANRLIENIKKYGQYPTVNQNDKYGGAYNQEQYQKWLVEEFLEKPFREQVDQKIDDRQAARRIADIMNKNKVEKAAQLTADIVENPWGEGTVPEKQYSVVPTTKLLPPAKEDIQQESPKATKKRGSSLVKSMTKTFSRMETHFQKLSQLSEVSETNITTVSDSFRVQQDALTKGFQDTTILITKITQAVDLQTSAMIRIAKGKKDFDQKRLDAQQALNEEMSLEQQKSASSTSKPTGGDGDSPKGGGGVGEAITKVLGGAVVGKFLAGKGLKLAQKTGGKIASKVTGKVLEKSVGKEAAESVLKNAGREAGEAGLEKGAAKFLGKKIPLVGLGLGTFFAAERAMKGDFLGAGLELASGAASTIPGFGTAGSVAIDAALIARDTGAMPFATGGLTKRSTFSNKRPGVTDLSPDLFKKMYQYEIDYEAKNKLKFGKLYADGYQKYFSNPALPGILSNLLGNLLNYFKDISLKIKDIIKNKLVKPISQKLRELQGGGYEYTDPNTNVKLTKTEDYGYSASRGRNHGGTDIATDSGTPLRAISDGEIVDSDSLSGGWGNFSVFKDNQNIYHLYGHMLSGYKRGGPVKKGDIIGKVGSTGASSGPHLHWETGTKWNGGTLEGKFDPLSRFKMEQPFFTSRDKSADKSAGETTQPTSIIKGLGIQNAMGNKNFGSVSGQGKKGYLIIPGHATGGGAPGEKSFVKKLAYNALTNIKAKFPDAPVQYMDVDSQFSDDNAGWEKQKAWYSKKESEGYEILEVHMDQSGGTGKGIIVPHKELNAVERDFARSHGAYERDYRSKPGELPLAAPSRGVSMIELGNMSPELQNKISSGKDNKSVLDKFTAPLEQSIQRGLDLKPKQKNMFDPRNWSQSANPQINKLVAMAPLEEQMTASTHIISVNNTNTIPIPVSTDSSGETRRSSDPFKQLHLASIS